MTEQIPEYSLMDETEAEPMDPNFHSPTPYSLTLTRSEIDAFDWIGLRYSAGQIAELLRTKCYAEPSAGEFHAWFNDAVPKVTFRIPEPVAWEINQLAEEEDYAFPCFADSLRGKLVRFCFSIV